MKNTPLMHAAVLAKSSALTSMLTYFLIRKDKEKINAMLHDNEDGHNTLPYLIEHSRETLIAPQGIILQLERDFHMKGHDDKRGFLKLENCIKMFQGASAETAAALQMLDK